MKRIFLKGLAVCFLLVTDLYPSQAAEKAGTLLRKQNIQCKRLIHYATQLHTRKDIPTLVKIRRQFRQALSVMETENLRLRQLSVLASYSDYILSIDEGVRHMQDLAEEPMDDSNLEEIRSLCTFISSIDEQMLLSLDDKTVQVYQTAAVH